MKNTIILGDGNKVAQPAQEMVATENAMKVFKVTDKTLDKASAIEGAYLDLSADRVISISKSGNNNDLLVCVSNYHSMIIPNDVEKINKFIGEGLHWLVENWHTYKSVKDCGEYWEVELDPNNLTVPKNREIMVFVVEHKVIEHGHEYSKLHYFYSKKESAKFRNHLIRHQISKMNLTEDFEYRYDYDNDTCCLLYELGSIQSYFHLYRMRINESDLKIDIDSTTFDDRIRMDDEFVEGQESPICISAFLPF